LYCYAEYLKLGYRIALLTDTCIPFAVVNKYVSESQRSYVENSKPCLKVNYGIYIKFVAKFMIVLEVNKPKTGVENGLLKQMHWFTLNLELKQKW